MKWVCGLSIAHLILAGFTIVATIHLQLWSKLRHSQTIRQLGAESLTHYTSYLNEKDLKNLSECVAPIRYFRWFSEQLPQVHAMFAAFHRHHLERVGSVIFATISKISRLNVMLAALLAKIAYHLGEGHK